MTSFGKHGNSLGEFQDPRLLTVDDCGVLYVCDAGNDRIQIF
jgi:hypothetical protein